MRNGIYILLVLALIACNKDKEPQRHFSPTYVSQDFPYYFPAMEIPADNPLTEEGIALGRKMYYDPIMDKNQARSCASCHYQSNSFTTVSSNSLAHINLGWSNAFLWNGKVEGTLEDIMLFEVEEFFETDISLLNNSPEYKRLFFDAFGIDVITSKHAAYALAQFQRTLSSYNSRYDKRLLGQVNLTAQEWDGYNIFFSERGDCFHCHGTALFTDNDFHNNALDANPENGRYDITNNPDDIGKFKTPTLRNIALTAPYMHDGRYQTLEEVVDFYCDDLQNSPTVDPLMKKVNQGGVALTQQERANLVAFLKTLTDSSYITNPDLSHP